MMPRHTPTPAALWVLAGLTAALLAWVPLPFGSVVPWSQSILQVTAFLLLGLAASTLGPRSWFGAATIPAAAIAAVAALALVQAAAWPPAIVRALSPAHADLTTQAATGTPGAWAAPAGIPFSLAPTATRQVALTWAAVAACLMVGGALSRVRRTRRILAFVLVAVGVAEVFLGASLLADNAATIWGVPVVASPTRLRGTFINSDHLALYLELILPVAFAWGWWAARRARESAPFERRVALLTPAVLLWLTLFVGLAFTGSRAGLVAASAGAVAQSLLLAVQRRHWRIGLVGATATVIGLGTVAAIGLQQGLGRWLATSQYELTWNDRIAAYAATIQLWERFPLLGTGLGTFREAFPLVAPAWLLSDNAVWRDAHNDYLELLVTTGVVGAALIATGLVSLLVSLARRLRDGEHSEDRAAALAALGALAAVAVHSCFDFGLSMPANSATLAVLCGAALCVGDQHAELEP